MNAEFESFSVHGNPDKPGCCELTIFYRDEVQVPGDITIELDQNNIFSIIECLQLFVI